MTLTKCRITRQRHQKGIRQGSTHKYWKSVLYLDINHSIRIKSIVLQTLLKDKREGCYPKMMTLKLKYNLLIYLTYICTWVNIPIRRLIGLK